MTESFKTYTNKTFIYKFLNVGPLLFVLGIILLLIPAKASDTKTEIIFFSLVVPGIIILIIGMLQGLFKSNVLFITDGEISLTEKDIILHQTTFPLIEIKKIELTAYNFKGKWRRAGMSDGSDNRIDITTKSNQNISCKFVIESQEQMNYLQSLMKEWKQNGVNIITNGFDLI